MSSRIYNCCVGRTTMLWRLMAGHFDDLMMTRQRSKSVCRSLEFGKADGFQI